VVLWRMLHVGLVRVVQVVHEGLLLVLDWGLVLVLVLITITSVPRGVRSLGP